MLPDIYELVFIATAVAILALWFTEDWRE